MTRASSLQYERVLPTSFPSAATASHSASRWRSLCCSSTGSKGLDLHPARTKTSRAGDRNALRMAAPSGPILLAHTHGELLPVEGVLDAVSGLLGALAHGFAALLRDMAHSLAALRGGVADLLAAFLEGVADFLAGLLDVLLGGTLRGERQRGGEQGGKEHRAPPFP